MNKPQGYTHSPHSNKPQSYFSRILIPDECSKTDRTSSKLKRPLFEGHAHSSPRLSIKRQTRRDAGLSSSYLNQTNANRMPTFLDFQPDLGYYSSALRRRLRPTSSLLAKGKAPHIPTEPVIDSKDTFGRALRILDSKKRAPLHLDAEPSPSIDSPTHQISDGQDSKRRRLLDVASVGSTKENDSFQFTSLEQLKKNSTNNESGNVSHPGGVNGVCTPPLLSSPHVMDVENPSDRSVVSTPVRGIRPASSRTPRTASAIRRLIPYLSPAELDALFFENKGKNEEGSMNEASDSETDFYVFSNYKAGQSSNLDSPVIKQEEASKMPDDDATSCQKISSAGRARDSHSVPRVGSVARFVASLESRTRKPSPLAGPSANRSNSFSVAPFQSYLPYRSPSDVISRVNRIRQLLSAQTEQNTTAQDGSAAGANSRMLTLPASDDSAQTTNTASILPTVPLPFASDLPSIVSSGASHVTPSVFTTTPNSTVTSSSALVFPSISTVASSLGIPAPTTNSLSSIGTTPTAARTTAPLFGLPNLTSTSSTTVLPIAVSATSGGLPGFSLPTTSGSSSSSVVPPVLASSTATTTATNNAVIITTTASTTANAAAVTATGNSTSTVPTTSVLPTLPAAVATDPVKVAMPFGAQSESSSAKTTSAIAASTPTQPPSLFSFKAPPLPASTNSVSVSSTSSTTTPLFTFGPTSGSPQVATSDSLPKPTSAGLGFTGTPFVFSKPPVSSNITNMITTSPSFSFNAPKSTSDPPSSSTVVPPKPSLFTFSPGVSPTTTTSNNPTSSVSVGIVGSSAAPLQFNFGGASPVNASMASSPAVTNTSTTVIPGQTAFPGFGFSSTLGSKPVPSGSLIPTGNVTGTSTSTSQTSNLFTMGVKPSSFGNSSFQPSPLLGSVERTQSNTASPFAGFTKPGAVTTTKTEVVNSPAPLLFGALTTSSQLTSSATAPGQLFSFGSNTSSSAPNTTPFSTSVTSSFFTFGQKPTPTVSLSTTSSSNVAFQGFGTGAMTSTVTSTTTSGTVGSTPFQFGTSPSLPTAAKFNFSSPSLASVSGTSLPAFGNSGGFNFGQTPSFTSPSPNTTNPFAFGTTPPAAPGAASAVALPRRRPASARRTRRM